jgi:hypothetical protein
MSKKGVMKPHTVKLLQMFDAGERDYQVLAEECGTTQTAVRMALCKYGRAAQCLPRGKLRDARLVQLPVSQAFVDEAKRRRKSCNRLAYELIKIIAQDNLFNGVLDDAEPVTHNVVHQ